MKIFLTTITSIFFVLNITFAQKLYDNKYGGYNIPDSIKIKNDLLSSKTEKLGYTIKSFNYDECNENASIKENKKLLSNFSAKKDSNIITLKTPVFLNCGCMEIHSWLELKNDSVINIIYADAGKRLRCVCVFCIDLQIEIDFQKTKKSKLKYYTINNKKTIRKIE